MPTWVWIVAVVVVVAVVGFVLLTRSVMNTTARWREEILRDGDAVRAWIVDLQPAQGLMWPVVHVLVSPDPDADDEFIRDLAYRVLKLKDTEPRDKDLAKVAKYAAGQSAENIVRKKLPKSFTNGREVYSTYIDLDPEIVTEAEADDSAYLDVKLCWDKHPTMAVVLRAEVKRKKSKKRGN